MRTTRLKKTSLQFGRSFFGQGWLRSGWGFLASGLMLFGAVNQGCGEAVRSPAIHSAMLVLEPEASPGEQRIAEVFKTRIIRHTPVPIEVGLARQPGADVYIHLGKVRASGGLHDLCARHNVRPPGKAPPNPEGFAVKTVPDGPDWVVIAVGTDDRGVLYATGEILRRLRFAADQLELPVVDVSTSPGFRFRGFSANQDGTMRTATKARHWTEAELHDVVLDYALAGGNCFYCEDQPGPLYEFLKSSSLLTTTGTRPNQLFGDHPKAWDAGGRVVENSLEVRKETYYALALARWLELEAERAESLEGLWADFVFTVKKMSFASVRLQAADWELAWGAEALIAAEWRERHEFQLDGPVTLEFHAAAGVMSKYVFDQLSELSAESWFKAASRWCATTAKPFRPVALVPQLAPV